MASGDEEDEDAPKFRVIDGGGKGRPDKPPTSFHTECARADFHTLCVELLRAIARGGDHGRRVARALNDLASSMRECSGPLSDIVSPVIWEMREGIGPEMVLGSESEVRAIVMSSLRVAAESIADDAAARGRRSKRVEQLEQDIRYHIEMREERRRVSASHRRAQAAFSGVLEHSPRKRAKRRLKPRADPDNA
jgi:hypothetical protein